MCWKSSDLVTQLSFIFLFLLHIHLFSYYQVLVGPEAGSSEAAGMTEEERLFDAVDWDVQPALDNNGIPTGKFQWDHTFPDRTDVAIMTNADIALAREFSGDAANKADLNNPSTGEGDYKDSVTGEVSCIFKCRRNNNCPRTPVCPGAWATLQIMDEYQSNLELWLTEFRDVFARMLHNKYQFDPTCEIEPCNLIGLSGGSACSESHQCLSGVCLGDGTCEAEA